MRRTTTRVVAFSSSFRSAVRCSTTSSPATKPVIARSSSAWASAAEAWGAAGCGSLVSLTPGFPVGSPPSLPVAALCRRSQTGAANGPEPRVLNQVLPCCTRIRKRWRVRLGTVAEARVWCPRPEKPARPTVHGRIAGRSARVAQRPAVLHMASVWPAKLDDRYV